jgi:uncharacterized membrane protein SpoIIM required for sporulation
MREGLFIKRNVQKWQEYEQLQTKDPDEMAERFTTLVDDLAYAKTFYPHSKVTRLINGLAVSIYQSIYQNKKENYSRIIRFFTTDLPLAIRQNHRVFLFSFSVFIICGLMGVISSRQDYEFVKGVLGENYVTMTEENIASGDPFGVYKNLADGGYFSSFIWLFFHNVKIDFLLFISGLLCGVFTLHLLFYNSVMLGCFQYLFFSKGLGLKSILVIWIHGTLEISAMIISATAGFIIARSILFPGSFRRIVSFKRGMKDALKIMIIFVPMTFGAAFLESYVTHLMSESFDTDGKDGMPVWASLLILAFSLSFVLWYFIVYPLRLESKLKRIPKPEPNVSVID